VSTKEQEIDTMVKMVAPATVWDLGANTGRFSHIASQYAKFVVSMDMDPVCVESNYKALSKRGIKNLLPIVVELNNPSPGSGMTESAHR